MSNLYYWEQLNTGNNWRTLSAFTIAQNKELAIERILATRKKEILEEDQSARYYADHKDRLDAEMEESLKKLKKELIKKEPIINPVAVVIEHIYM